MAGINADRHGEGQTRTGAGDVNGVSLRKASKPKRRANSLEVMVDGSVAELDVCELLRAIGSFDTATACRIPVLILRRHAASGWRANRRRLLRRPDGDGDIIRDRRAGVYSRTAFSAYRRYARPCSRISCGGGRRRRPTICFASSAAPRSSR